MVAERRQYSWTKCTPFLMAVCRKPLPFVCMLKLLSQHDVLLNVGFDSRWYLEPPHYHCPLDSIFKLHLHWFPYEMLYDKTFPFCKMHFMYFMFLTRAFALPEDINLRFIFRPVLCICVCDSEKTERVKRTEHQRVTGDGHINCFKCDGSWFHSQARIRCSYLREHYTTIIATQGLLKHGKKKGFNMPRWFTSLRNSSWQFYEICARWDSTLKSVTHCWQKTIKNFHI